MNLMHQFKILHLIFRIASTIKCEIIRVGRHVPVSLIECLLKMMPNLNFFDINCETEFDALLKMSYLPSTIRLLNDNGDIYETFNKR